MAVTVRERERTPLWRNAAFLKWSSQLFVLLVTLGFFVILGRQAFANFSASGTTFDLDFLTDPIGVFLREGIDTEPDSSIRALTVGAMNTLRVAITGIIAATLV